MALQVRILCPDVEDHTGLNGQLLEIEVASLLDTVADIKARLAEVLALPGNKQRITRDGVGVLQVCCSMPVPSYLTLCRPADRAAQPDAINGGPKAPGRHSAWATSEMQGLHA